MIRIITVYDEVKRAAQATEKYYNTASPDEIERMRFDIFSPRKNLNERQEAFVKHQKTILALKPLFKQIIIELNKRGQIAGFNNYFEYAMKNKGIPKEKLKLFFNKADKVIKDINKHLPIPDSFPNWFWSKFNIPDALALVKVKKYSIPDDIYEIVKKIQPGLKKFIPRIKVRGKVKGFYPAAIYNKNDKTVAIEVPTEPSIYHTLIFVHELGHAISLLKDADKGKDPLSRNRYWMEKEACKFKFEFEESALPEEVKNASRGAILGTFLTAFFEHEIFTNPDQDFDKTYARVINRGYPGKSKQTKNPLYVLENSLIFRPCGTVTSSVAQVELLLTRKPRKKKKFALPHQF